MLHCFLEMEGNYYEEFCFFSFLFFFVFFLYLDLLTLSRPLRSSPLPLLQLSLLRSSSYHALRLLPPNVRSSSSMTMGCTQAWAAASSSLAEGSRARRSEGT
ncbi:hypothetical protein N3K66_008688 [Trichothecium roseum]|uniref:Uncharacterized protein n=1 Tax=Trichothecium roseum TaxID=47278 RepID=A0ACC0UQW8_9HYPO|nr:hypothetical protein N3K66_008688 [Trichothecium roseum]